VRLARRPTGTGWIPTYLTPEQVAEALQVSRRTVYEWLKLGRLRGVRAGKAWRIEPKDVKAFLMPPAEWERRMDRMLDQVRNRLPADISPDEIEADITAALDEIRRGPGASSR